MDMLCQWERQSQGCLPTPSTGCAECQSIKTARQGEDVSCDGHKKITGHKWHLLVDTLGRIVAVVVITVTIDDRQGLVALPQRPCTAGVTRLRARWVDSGDDASWLCDWIRGLKRTHQVGLEVGEHSGKRFQVGPYRWVIERTFA